MGTPTGAGGRSLGLGTADAGVFVSENPNVLIAEAEKVVEYSYRYMEVAEELVDGIPRRREAAMERVAAARERDRQARERLSALRYDDEAERWEVQEAEQEAHSASWAVYSAEDRLGGDDLDPENRKTVARHLVALIREDAEQRLRAIDSRSDDPEARRAVAERRDEVARSARYLTSLYAEASSLEHREVVTTRAEGHKIMKRLKNPPTDR